ncbi:MAG TPA: transglycosylase domain-containing protein, partial [Bacilli bacterium]|nr:transglycosylase domain-containing protein [Bacilli bacterium]
MKKKIKKIKKFIYSHQAEALLVIISLVGLIIGCLAIGFLAIPIIIVIDLCIIFYPQIINYINKFKRNFNKSNTNTRRNNKIKNTSINNKEIKENKEEGSMSEMKKRSTSKIIKDKRVKEKKPRTKNKKRKTIKIIIIVCLIGIILAFAAFSAFWIYIMTNAPKFNADNLYKKESSVLYDIDGKEFAKLGTEYREKITYEELPEVLINAIVATEDSRFFQHNGFDLPRFIKASIGQIVGSSNAGGASTLTMQISKNAFTSTESTGVQGIIRKFTDIYVSMNEIEKNYTKEEILEFYVNSYCLGGNVFGVEQAAQTYFGKHAKDLNLSEAAIIAGLFQAPNTYNPIRNPKNATYRRKIVLSLMVRHGYITKEEADVANAIPVEKLVVAKSGATSNNAYQGFIDTVVAEVKEDTGLNPYTTSMEIHTTMNRAKQDVVNAAMSGQTYAWENDYVDAGVSVIDPKTGAVAAIGTGRDTSAAGLYNNATQIKRQIGSTAKPLYAYGPAVEFNNLSPYNYVGDEPYSYSDGTSISNWDGAYQSLLTARQALAGSRNIPALKVFQQVKNSSILDFVTKLGLSPEASGGSLHQAHSIGGYNGESPLSVSAAYAAFINGGYYHEPHSYTKITYRDSGKTTEKKYKTTQAMKDSTAYIIFNMLVSTSQEAMRGYRNINNWTYGAKTGTSNFTAETKAANKLASDAINDLWCTGVNDEYAISVWYGYEKINSQYYSHFGNSNHIILLKTLASSIWTRGAEIAQPDSVVNVTVEAGNIDEAKLPSQYTPADQITSELFVKGSEPTEVSTRFTQLSNVKNLKGTYSNGTVSLTWEAITTPNELNRDYLNKYFSKLFTNQAWLGDAVNNRYSYFANNLGGIAYDIYQKDGDNLKFVTTTTNTKADFSTQAA